MPAKGLAGAQEALPRAQAQLRDGGHQGGGLGGRVGRIGLHGSRPLLGRQLSAALKAKRIRKKERKIEKSLPRPRKKKEERKKNAREKNAIEPRRTEAARPLSHSPTLFDPFSGEASFIDGWPPPPHYVVDSYTPKIFQAPFQMTFSNSPTLSIPSHIFAKRVRAPVFLRRQRGLAENEKKNV